MSIIILFRRVMVTDLASNTIHTKPLLNYFMYLRIYDMFVIIGFFQLLMDLHLSHKPEIEAAEEIHNMMKNQREKIGKYNTENV